VTAMLFIFVVQNTFAQTDSLELDDLFDIDAADVTEDEHVNETAEDFTEYIDRLLLAPPNIATIPDLRRSYIPYVSDMDILRAGDISDSSRLFSDLISGRRDLVRYILARKPRKNNVVSLRSRVLLQPELIDTKEYLNRTYRGSPEKLYNRLLYASGSVTAGILQAKDYGEPLFFDQVTAYLAINGSTGLTEHLSIGSVILGDYTLSFGQGLILNSGIRSYKSRSAIAPLVPDRTKASPYLSSYAGTFFRGAVTNIELGGLVITPFFSERFQDASVSDTGTITSLSYTGYHRTTNELARRNALGTNAYGTMVTYDQAVGSGYLTLGSALYHEQYGNAVVSSDTLRTRFRGTDISLYSLSASFAEASYMLSAEGSYSITPSVQSPAFAAVGIIRITESTDAAAQIRILPEKFISPSGSVFGDNTDDAGNETGTYVGLRQRLIDGKLNLEGYADLSMRKDFGGDQMFEPFTSDYRLLLEYTPVKTEMIIRLESRIRSREEVKRMYDSSYGLVSGKRINEKFDAVLRLSKSMLVRVRGSFVHYAITDRNENGFAGGFSFRTDLIDEIRLETGAVVYQTDSYDSRIYYYESDIPGVFGLTPLYGSGSRLYAMISASFGSWLRADGKVTRMRYTYNEQPAERTIISIQLGIQL
jgi:hypothetical protein